MILKIRFVTSLVEPRQNASENPSHLWHPFRSTTATLTPLGVVIVLGGWVCVLSNLVLSSFKMKPSFANATTSSSSKYAACCDDVARTANLKSSKGPPPSSKSIPSVLTRILHLFFFFLTLILYAEWRPSQGTGSETQKHCMYNLYMKTWKQHHAWTNAMKLAWYWNKRSVLRAMFSQVPK